ncbi:MAG TPA: hypothetical protein VF748_15020 [Candidatus Acidoferrum sp.]
MTDEVFPNGNHRQQSARVDLAPQRDDPKTLSGAELDADEIEELRARAREIVAEDQREAKRKAYLQQFLDEERKLHDPKEQLFPVFLQLAPHAAYIMLDGTQYFTNTLYNVTRNKLAVLIEQMNRGWAHEEITEVRDPKRRQRFRPPPGIGFGNFMDNRIPRNLVLSSEQLAGAVSQMHAVMQG